MTSGELETGFTGPKAPCRLLIARAAPANPPAIQRARLRHAQQSDAPWRCIRPKTPLNLDEAKRLVSAYVSDYNHHRLHSAIGYVAPADKLAGKAPEILADRDRKLLEARQLCAQRRQAQLQLSMDA